MSIKKALHQKDKWHHAYLIVGDGERAFKELQSVLDDYIFFEANNLGIDISREIRRRASLGKRNFIIKACSFTREAQNALLKILEEPLAEVHFFILVPHIFGILPTLLSRVVILRLASEGTDDTEIIPAHHFLAATPAQRLKMLTPLSKKYEEHDRRAEIKREALDFLNRLEVELEKRLPRNLRSLENMSRVKQYLYADSAHVGLILEHLAFVI